MAVKPSPQTKPRIDSSAGKPSRPPVEPSSERSGRYEPRPIGELSGRLVAKPLGKRGFATAALVADWATIVGPMLATATLPLRIAFPHGERNHGTLHLKVSSGAMALQMQHLGPLIIERINGHFGYRAVARLALTQGPVPNRAPPPDTGDTRNKKDVHRVDPALAAMIEALPDEDLKKALAGLGRQLARRGIGLNIRPSI